MTRRKSRLAQIFFLFRGGHRLDGRKEEFSARAFHLLLVCTLLWLCVQLFLIVPLFAVRKSLGAAIYLAQSGATLGALVWLRWGRDRAAAILFLSVMWCVGTGVSTFNGGVAASGIYMALALSLNAAWLLNRTSAVGCAAATLAVSLVEAVLEHTGIIAAGIRSSPLTVWNGQVLIVLLTINPILGVLEALRRQVAALKGSEQRFRTIVDAIDDAVFIFDLDSLEVVDANARACELLGIAAEECRGIALERLAATDPPASRVEFLSRVETARTGDPRIFEYRFHPSETGSRTGRDPIWVEITAQRSRVADRDRLVLLARDIDSRKRAEEEKTHLEAQLQQSQRLESVGRLAGGVAHDFNNMLTVILGYAKMLKGDMPAGSKQLKFVSEIEKAGNRSKEITQQLLGFSRQQIINPLPANLNDLLRDLMEPLGRLIGEDIDLGFYPRPDLWTVALDPSQVNQILLNLMVNARDAMPSGGKLTIETANATIPEQYCRTHADSLPGEFVVLSVSDTGVGIPADILPKIFEPFFSTKSKDVGTGLGLSVIYGIVKQNGGFVNVYSEPAQGSTFRIYFPRMAGERGEEAPVASAAPMAAGSGTVLVVEDDDLVREMVTSSLEDLGYTALVASSPLQAIELCAAASAETSNLRLVLTDVVMPGMNGTELRDRIHAVYPGLRVLFMSGYTSNVIVKHGILKPGLHFIQKPFTVEELGRRIEDVLR